MLFQPLIHAIQKSRNQETCYPGTKHQRTQEQPEFGQCTVTSLYIYEVFGGTLGYDTKANHCRNILDSGEEIDLTRTQFGPDVIIVCDERRAPTRLLDSPGAIRMQTRERYELFKKRVAEHLLS